MSFKSMRMISARLPGVRLPTTLSSPSARAPLIVVIAIHWRNSRGSSFSVDVPSFGIPMSQAIRIEEKASDLRRREERVTRIELA